MCGVISSATKKVVDEVKRTPVSKELKRFGKKGQAEIDRLRGKSDADASELETTEVMADKPIPGAAEFKRADRMKQLMRGRRMGILSTKKIGGLGLSGYSTGMQSTFGKQ